MPTTASASVLDEDEALELLAYLVTAARTQVDEAAEYGPLRLLTAARRLAERIAPRSSDGTAGVLTGPPPRVARLRGRAGFRAGRPERVPELAGPRAGRAEYVARLDELCRALAAHLSARWAPDDA